MNAQLFLFIILLCALFEDTYVMIVNRFLFINKALYNSTYHHRRPYLFRFVG